ncbi:MAG: cyclic nucleotide-binding domain-containing protein [Anaerolineales bacterium]|nr:cyclic nucleotide-binding domain-containing protein [Anaerolineales bacterium]
MPDVKETVSVLDRTPLFRGLKKNQLERLARRFVEREYEEGKAMVTQGQGGEGFFIITSGHADVIRERLDGSKEKVNEFKTGDFFGELALLDDGPRTASVIATEATTCLVLARWDFFGVLKEDVDTAITILQEMAKRFRMALEVL